MGPQIDARALPNGEGLLQGPVRLRILFFGLLLGNLVACDDGGPTAPRGEPLIEGWITRTGIGIASIDKLTILVEEDPGDPVGGESDRVFFFLDVFTPVRLDVGKSPRRMVGIKGLNVGQRVRVWSKGIILQSDPAQVGAAFIDIICEDAESCGEVSGTVAAPVGNLLREDFE